MEVNELQKWNIAHRIYCNYDFSPILNKLESIIRDTSVKFIKERIAETSSTLFKPLPDYFKIAIIDFEGSPVFLFGILIKETIFTYYIETYSHRNELYLIIFQVLIIARDLTFFAFSEHERLELLNMFQYLEVQGIDMTPYYIIINIPIINLQKDNLKFESLTEAIYSINPNSMQMTGDALFRNNKLVNKLFRAQKFNEIIVHNINCLLNEALIFLKRWYKNNKI